MCIITYNLYIAIASMAVKKDVLRLDFMQIVNRILIKNSYVPTLIQIFMFLLQHRK